MILLPFLIYLAQSCRPRSRVQKEKKETKETSQINQSNYA